MDFGTHVTLPFVSDVCVPFRWFVRPLSITKGSPIQYTGFVYFFPHALSSSSSFRNQAYISAIFTTFLRFSFPFFISFQTISTRLFTKLEELSFIPYHSYTVLLSQSPLPLPLSISPSAHIRQWAVLSTTPCDGASKRVSPGVGVRHSALILST